ncbi:TPA: hypothetical protein PMC50_002513 [Vibrio cholerae]|nr:hypothetical protein [Vibrio cholerae]
MTQIVLRGKDFIVSEVKVKTLTPNFVTESLTGKVNAQSRGLHSLEFSFKVTLEDADDIRKFNALMLKIQGRLNPFVLSLVDEIDGEGYCNPLHTPNPIRLSHEAPKGSTRISVNAPQGVKAGTMFQLPNDTKVYTILDDVRSSGSVEIYPAIRVAHSINTTLKTTVEPFIRLSDDVFEVDYNKVSEVTIKAREVL